MWRNSEATTANSSNLASSCSEKCPHPLLVSSVWKNIPWSLVAFTQAFSCGNSLIASSKDRRESTRTWVVSRLVTQFDSNHLATCGNMVDLCWSSIGGWYSLHGYHMFTFWNSRPKHQKVWWQWWWLIVSWPGYQKRYQKIWSTEWECSAPNSGAFCSSQVSFEVKASPSTAISPKNILGRVTLTIQSLHQSGITKTMICSSEI